VNNRNVEVNGFRLLIDQEDSLGLASGAIFEPDTLDALKRLTKTGDHVLDVGANIGYFTLVLASLVGPSGRVFAIEPQSENFRRLSENVHNNNLQNVSTSHIAVGESEGTSSLYLSNYNGGMHRLYKSVCCTDTSETVLVKTIDSIVQNTRISLIKIDIEGYEYFALKGASNCLANNPDINIVTEYCPASAIEAGASPLCFLEYLEQMQFKPATLYGEFVDLEELKDDARKYEGYGHERLIADCFGKDNTEILGIITSIANQIGCRRPILENLHFARSHQPQSRPSSPKPISRFQFFKSFFNPVA